MRNDFDSLPPEIIAKLMSLLHEVNGEFEVIDDRQFVDFVKENENRYPALRGLLKLSDDAIRAHIERTGKAPPGIRAIRTTTSDDSNVTKLEIFLPPDSDDE